jgi:hypothetical protein
LTCNLFYSILFYKPILKRLQIKAQQAYRDANSGLPSKIPNDIFKPSNPEEETKNELSIFSGKTHTLTAKSTSSTAVASTANTANTSPSSSNKLRSSSDSPQLVMPDNPSFKNVHPSLVSELNVFNGLIKRQLENAYKAGGEVFGGGEPMVVDGQGSDGGNSGVHHHHQPTQMHDVRQHQQQQQLQQQQQPQQVMYQPDYQRQHFDKQEAMRLEREAANREMERQEMENHEVERQELARQQQLQQQREIQRREIQRQQAHGPEIRTQQQHELLRQQQQAQQEVIQHQQQLDIRRQQEKQQQMQDQYRQQLEVQQHQLQQRQLPQYHLQRHSYDHHDQLPMFTEPDHGMVTSSAHPTAPPILTLSHSQSQPNIHHAYQQHHYPDTTAGLSSYAPPRPAQRVTQRAQQPIRYSTVAQQSLPQQHSMYVVPPEYSSPDSIQTGISYVPPPTSTYLPPTPISATPSPSSYVPHWSASSYSFAMPDQQATSASTVSGSGSAGSVHTWASIPRKQTPEYQQHQQYTPEGALRGIAADDRSLQETWQSYMNKVPNVLFFCILSSDDANPLISFFIGWLSAAVR